MWVAFANAKATHIFFSKDISVRVYAIFNVQSFNDALTKDIVSFEQLDPDKFFFFLYEMTKQKNTLSKHKGQENELRQKYCLEMVSNKTVLVCMWGLCVSGVGA